MFINYLRACAVSNLHDSIVKTKELYFILDINSGRLAGFPLIIRLIKSDANSLPIG